MNVVELLDWIKDELELKLKPDLLDQPSPLRELLDRYEAELQEALDALDGPKLVVRVVAQLDCELYSGNSDVEHDEGDGA